MVDVHLHFRAVGTERRNLPAVPTIGAYIVGPGVERRLWLVQAVVFDRLAVEVYAVEVSDRLAGELTTAWREWAEPIEDEATASEAPTTGCVEPDRNVGAGGGLSSARALPAAAAIQPGGSARRGPSPAKPHFPAIAAAEVGEAAATLGKAGCTGDVANCTCPACAKERIKRRTKG